MCGIAGIVGREPAALGKVAAMLSVMEHRGPDASGLMEPGVGIVLGHQRLRIIDLSAAANQPFQSADGRYTLVFNGEIYNHVELGNALRQKYPFRTQSDTEVLLYAYQEWGKDCLERLVGMFAFAIWDHYTRSLFAARDRFGVKPFYYVLTENALYFASEIKALWAAGIEKQASESVWASYLVYGTYGMPEETFWEGVWQLPGGHWLTYSGADTVVTCWYNFPERVGRLPVCSMEEAVEQWLALATESVRLRFRADVPLGLNVSGGLDSSLLIALIRRCFPEAAGIEAFTFGTGDKRYDEWPWVERAAAQARFSLHKVQLQAAEVPELTAAVDAMADEPYGGIPTLAYSRIFETARRRGVLVLLDGQGIDEAWAGYDYYQSGSPYLVQGSGTSPVRPECLDPTFRNKARKPLFPEPFQSGLQNMQYRDLFYTKIPRALRFNDRVSMMYGTELREPFLDHRLVELAFSLPASCKIRHGEGKWLLRQLGRSLLPEGLALAPKRPVQTPQREWLSGVLQPWVSARLQQLESHPWFDYSKVQQEWDTFQHGQQDNSFFVWQWIGVGGIRRQ